MDRSAQSRARTLLLVVGILLLVMSSAVPAAAAPTKRPLANVSVCLVDGDTIRLTLTWQNFLANQWISAVFKWEPRATVGGHDEPVDPPTSSGAVSHEITVDPTGENGPTQAMFDSWDRGAGGVSFYDDGAGTTVIGPSDDMRRPHFGWPSC